MSDMVQEGELIEVKLTIRVPASASENDVEAWLMFGLVASGGISMDNPLFEHEIDMWGYDGLEWDRTGFIGTREEYDHETLGEGRFRRKVRFRETRIP